MFISKKDLNDLKSNVQENFDKRSFDIKHICKEMDALMAYLGLEFVERTEKVNQGRFIEEETQCFMRKIKK